MDFTSISSDPELFIAQLEYSLESKGITSQKGKFAHVVPLLPADIGQGYYSKPAIHEPFSRIKKGNFKQNCGVGLKKNSPSFLSEERLSDKKPSEFLRRLEELAGINKENPIIRHICLSQLPEKWQPLTTVSFGRN